MGEQPLAAEIVAAMPVAVLIINPAGDVTDVNATAEMLLNTGRGALLGKPLSAHIMIADQLHDFDREYSESPFAAYDVLISNQRGLKLLADITMSPIPEYNGWRIMAIHAGGGAHARNRRREQGSGARSAIGAAAMLAHEIKNPLSGISGAAQLLERKIAPESRAMTQLIRAEVDRIAGLIDRMEGFTDTRPLALEAGNIYPILDHVSSLAKHGFAQNIDIKTEYDPSLPMALIHKDALTQIIINLIKNAAEAMIDRERPMIRLTTAFRHGISVSSRGGQGRHALPIEVCVIDNGPGPPPEIADHLFEPFVSTKRSAGGLGLALVDKLVRDMGGIIQFSREGEPECTIFRLLLQRA